MHRDKGSGRVLCTGCDIIQGYYYAKLMPVDQFEKHIYSIIYDYVYRKMRESFIMYVQFADCVKTLHIVYL